MLLFFSPSLRAKGLPKLGSLTKRFKSASDLLRHGNVLGGENIEPLALATFEAWHQAVSGSLHDGKPPTDAKELMIKHVAEDCMFYPPTYHTPWKGREEFLLIIECVSEGGLKLLLLWHGVIIVVQWLSPDGRDWALEFKAEIGSTKKMMTGIDVVKLNDKGEIMEFMVLARPPNAVAELKKAMMQKVPLRLAKLKAKQSISNIFS